MTEEHFAELGNAVREQVTEIKDSLYGDDDKVFYIYNTTIFLPHPTKDTKSIKYYIEIHIIDHQYKWNLV